MQLPPPSSVPCLRLSLSHWQQLVHQAPSLWNGFRSCVHTPPTAEGRQMLFVKTGPATPVASNSMAVAIKSEGTGLQTFNSSIHLLFLALNRHQVSRFPQSTQILHSHSRVLLKAYDKETLFSGYVRNVPLRQQWNNKLPFMKNSWKLKKMPNFKRPSLSL
jgi:hypothetical protein